MKIYIETAGCSANLSNAEIMAGLLEKAGHLIVNSEKNADLVILNTCIVKGPTETKALKRIKEISKPLIITGCLPRVREISTKSKHFALLSPQNITKITDVVEQLAGQKEIEERYEEKLNLPRKRANKLIHIVQICEGCLGNCTYCITKFAKGKLFVYPADKIISDVKQAISEGCKEVWLTAQDTGCYPNLPKLLKDICSIPSNFRVRLGMLNPNHLIKIIDELIPVLKNEKMFKFLHIPVQSGNNRILKLMNRFYTVEDFKSVVKKARKEIPNITISTDIICGFPSETDEEFEDSLNLIKEIQPNVLNISRFWPMKGTKAAEMQGYSGKITKERSQKMTKLFDEIAFEQKQALIGKEFTILIDEKGKNNTFVGKTENYLAVVVKKAKLGDFVRVKITDAKKDWLKGKII